VVCKWLITHRLSTMRRKRPPAHRHEPCGIGKAKIVDFRGTSLALCSHHRKALKARGTRKMKVQDERLF
jgi:hypothetical protein